MAQQNAQSTFSALPANTPSRRKSRDQLLARLWKYRFFYLLALPGVLFFIIFHYLPMLRRGSASSISSVSSIPFSLSTFSKTRSPSAASSCSSGSRPRSCSRSC
jgi:hypothetical protein